MPTFRAPIEEARGGGGAWVEVPPFVISELGGGGRIPVHASFDGIPYRGSVVGMGSGGMVIGILKDIRTRLAKEIGDEVEVTLVRDNAKRDVEVPEDLAAALKQAGLSEVFEALSFSKRRQLVNGVVDAKHPETRQRRIATTLEQLGARD